MWLWLPGSVFTQESPLAQTRPLVEIRTEAGDMIVALYNETPQHRDQFLALVDAGAYDSLLFHRIVPGFALEGGDPTSKRAAPGVALGQGPGKGGLPNEIHPGLIHKKGALAAAAAGDSPELAKRSHETHFFIVQGAPYNSTELALVAERNARLAAPFMYSEEDQRTYSNSGGQPRLDGSYTVFGEVVEGLEVIDILAKQPCNSWDRPLTDIRMFMRKLK